MLSKSKLFRCLNNLDADFSKFIPVNLVVV